MYKVFTTCPKQKQSDQPVTAVKNVYSIPDDASPDHGWVLKVSIIAIQQKLTVKGKRYFVMRVNDRLDVGFLIVVWVYHSVGHVRTIRGRQIVGIGGQGSYRRLCGLDSF